VQIGRTVAIAAVAVGLLLSGCGDDAERGEGPEDASDVRLPPPAADAPSAEAVFTGPGAVLHEHRERTAPLLDLRDQPPAQRVQTCESVRVALEGGADPVTIVLAATDVGDPVLVELFLGEHAARRELLAACLAGDRRAVVQRVEQARLVDALIQRRLEQL
jgi:hypothetical protein